MEKMEIGSSVSEAGLHAVGIGKNFFIMAVETELELVEAEGALKFSGEWSPQKEFIFAAMYLVTLVAFPVAYRAVFVKTPLYFSRYFFVAGKT